MIYHNFGEDIYIYIFEQLTIQWKNNVPYTQYQVWKFKRLTGSLKWKYWIVTYEMSAWMLWILRANLSKLLILINCGNCQICMYIICLDMIYDSDRKRQLL